MRFDLIREAEIVFLSPTRLLYCLTVSYWKKQTIYDTSVVITANMKNRRITQKTGMHYLISYSKVLSDIKYLLLQTFVGFPKQA